MEAKQKAETHHIAILPTPGMGHLIPLIELARNLHRHHHHSLSITFIIPDDDLFTPPQRALLHSFPAINSVFLPPAATAAVLPDDASIEDRFIHSALALIPSLRRVLSQLNESTRLSALIVDHFGLPTFDAVNELGLPVYLFFPSSAMTLSLALHLPDLDMSTTGEYRDLPEPVRLPGCVPVRGSDLLDPAQDRTSQTYRGCLEMCLKYRLVDGILVNSFLDLEPDALKAFQQESTFPPVYPVGPLTRTDSGDEKAECIAWLDGQPAGSVLFVAFGSGGTLSRNQLKELALGLEKSGQRFLFVVRKPNDDVRNAGYFASPKDDDPNEYLPSGFIERSKGKGLVWFNWAPQIEILRHVALGGFLTHAGWNSTLESVVSGMPLIVWPLFAEQRMNAVLLSEGLKVTFRVEENENGVVDSEQLSLLVSRLIEGREGEEIRTRMRNLRDAAGRALAQHGSSTIALADVVDKWKTS